MYCSSCGAARSSVRASFCTSCGAPFPAGSDPNDATAVLPAVPGEHRGAAPTPPTPPTPPAAGRPQHRSRRPVLVAATIVAVVVAVAAATALARSGWGRGVKASGTAVAKPSASPSPSPTPSPSPPAASFASLYSLVSSGVVRIETTACAGGGVGSGFLLAPDLVGTVAHVVQGAQSIIIRDGTTSTTGTVVGLDAQRELALVRTASPLPGHVFALADREPQVGDDVAAIGYPLAGDESLTKGSVSGLNRQENVEGTQLDNLMQTDTAINPGNSGGPLLTVDGGVVGLVEAKDINAENIAFAVPASTAAGTLRAWQAQPTPVPVGHCAAPTGPTGIVAGVTDHSGSADGPSLARLFSRYATGINTGDYASAYAELSPAAQSRTSLRAFRAGEVSSYLFELDLHQVTSVAPGRDRAELSFTSVQDPVVGGTGQGCSQWQLTYTLIAGGDTGWLIDSARPRPGSPVAC